MDDCIELVNVMDESEDALLRWDRLKRQSEQPDAPKPERIMTDAEQLRVRTAIDWNQWLHERLAEERKLILDAVGIAVGEQLE